MIVVHSFFYKSHPRYLDGAVSMMRKVNNCAFMLHDDFDTFVRHLRDRLKEDTDGRYERGDISVTKSSGQVQINVKHGLDYAARMNYGIVEKGLGYTSLSERPITAWKFTSEGDMNFVNKDREE